MKHRVVPGILVGLIVVVAGCNPFLDRSAQIRGEGPMLSGLAGPESDRAGTPPHARSVNDPPQALGHHEADERLLQRPEPALVRGKGGSTTP